MSRISHEDLSALGITHSAPGEQLAIAVQPQITQWSNFQNYLAGTNDSGPTFTIPRAKQKILTPTVTLTQGKKKRCLSDNGINGRSVHEFTPEEEDVLRVCGNSLQNYFTAISELEDKPALSAASSANLLQMGQKYPENVKKMHTAIKEVIKVIKEGKDLDPFTWEYLEPLYQGFFGKNKAETLAKLERIAAFIDDKILEEDQDEKLKAFKAGNSVEELIKEYESFSDRKDRTSKVGKGVGGGQADVKTVFTTHNPTWVKKHSVRWATAAAGHKNDKLKTNDDADAKIENHNLRQLDYLQFLVETGQKMQKFEREVPSGGGVIKEQKTLYYTPDGVLRLQAGNKRNPNDQPYIPKDDERFAFLQTFLKYFIRETETGSAPIVKKTDSDTETKRKIGDVINAEDKKIQGYMASVKNDVAKVQDLSQFTDLSQISADNRLEFAKFLKERNQILRLARALSKRTNQFDAMVSRMADLQLIEPGIAPDLASQHVKVMTKLVEDLNAKCGMNALEPKAWLIGEFKQITLAATKSVIDSGIIGATEVKDQKDILIGYDNFQDNIETLCKGDSKAIEAAIKKVEAALTLFQGDPEKGVLELRFDDACEQQKLYELDGDEDVNREKDTARSELKARKLELESALEKLRTALNSKKNPAFDAELDGIVADTKATRRTLNDAMTGETTMDIESSHEVPNYISKSDLARKQSELENETDETLGQYGTNAQLATKRYPALASRAAALNLKLTSGEYKAYGDAKATARTRVGMLQNLIDDSTTIAGDVARNTQAELSARDQIVDEINKTKETPSGNQERLTQAGCFGDVRGLLSTPQGMQVLSNMIANIDLAINQCAASLAEAKKSLEKKPYSTRVQNAYTLVKGVIDEYERELRRARAELIGALIFKATNIQKSAENLRPDAYNPGDFDRIQAEIDRLRDELNLLPVPSAINVGEYKNAYDQAERAIAAAEERLEMARLEAELNDAIDQILNQAGSLYQSLNQLYGDDAKRYRDSVINKGLNSEISDGIQRENKFKEALAALGTNYSRVKKAGELVRNAINIVDQHIIAKHTGLNAMNEGLQKEADRRVKIIADIVNEKAPSDTAYSACEPAFEFANKLASKMEMEDSSGSPMGSAGGAKPKDDEFLIAGEIFSPDLIKGHIINLMKGLEAYEIAKPKVDEINTKMDTDRVPTNDVAARNAYNTAIESIAKIEEKSLTNEGLTKQGLTQQNDDEEKAIKKLDAALAKYLTDAGTGLKKANENDKAVLLAFARDAIEKIKKVFGDNIPDNIPIIFEKLRNAIPVLNDIIARAEDDLELQYQALIEASYVLNAGFLDPSYLFKKTEKTTTHDVNEDKYMKYLLNHDIDQLSVLEDKASNAVSDLTGHIDKISRLNKLNEQYETIGKDKKKKGTPLFKANEAANILIPTNMENAKRALQMIREAITLKQGDEAKVNEIKQFDARLANIDLLIKDPKTYGKYDELVAARKEYAQLGQIIEEVNESIIDRPDHLQFPKAAVAYDIFKENVQRKREEFERGLQAFDDEISKRQINRNEDVFRNLINSRNGGVPKDIKKYQIDFNDKNIGSVTKSCTDEVDHFLEETENKINSIPDTVPEDQFDTHNSTLENEKATLNETLLYIKRARYLDQPTPDGKYFRSNNKVPGYLPAHYKDQNINHQTMLDNYIARIEDDIAKILTKQLNMADGQVSTICNHSEFGDLRKLEADDLTADYAVLKRRHDACNEAIPKLQALHRMLSQQQANLVGDDLNDVQNKIKAIETYIHQIDNNMNNLENEMKNREDDRIRTTLIGVDNAVRRFTKNNEPRYKRTPLEKDPFRYVFADKNDDNAAIQAVRKYTDEYSGWLDKRLVKVNENLAEVVVPPIDKLTLQQYTEKSQLLAAYKIELQLALGDLEDAKAPCPKHWKNLRKTDGYLAPQWSRSGETHDQILDRQIAEIKRLQTVVLQNQKALDDAFIAGLITHPTLGNLLDPPNLNAPYVNDSSNKPTLIEHRDARVNAIDVLRAAIREKEAQKVGLDVNSPALGVIQASIDQYNAHIQTLNQHVKLLDDPAKGEIGWREFYRIRNTLHWVGSAASALQRGQDAFANGPVKKIETRVTFTDTDNGAAIRSLTDRNSNYLGDRLVKAETNITNIIAVNATIGEQEFLDKSKLLMQDRDQLLDALERLRKADMNFPPPIDTWEFNGQRVTEGYLAPHWNGAGGETHKAMLAKHMAKIRDLLALVQQQEINLQNAYARGILVKNGIDPTLPSLKDLHKLPYKQVVDIFNQYTAAMQSIKKLIENRKATYDVTGLNAIYDNVDLRCKQILEEADFRVIQRNEHTVHCLRDAVRKAGAAIPGITGYRDLWGPERARRGTRYDDQYRNLFEQEFLEQSGDMYQVYIFIRNEFIRIHDSGETAEHKLVQLQKIDVKMLQEAIADLDEALVNEPGRGSLQTAFRNSVDGYYSGLEIKQHDPYCERMLREHRANLLELLKVKLDYENKLKTELNGPMESEATRVGKIIRQEKGIDVDRSAVIRRNSDVFRMIMLIPDPVARQKIYKQLERKKGYVHFTHPDGKTQYTLLLEDYIVPGDAAGAKAIDDKSMMECHIRQLDHYVKDPAKTNARPEKELRTFKLYKNTYDQLSDAVKTLKYGEEFVATTLKDFDVFGVSSEAMQKRTTDVKDAYYLAQVAGGWDELEKLMSKDNYDKIQQQVKEQGFTALTKNAAAAAKSSIPPAGATIASNRSGSATPVAPMGAPCLLTMTKGIKDTYSQATSGGADPGRVHMKLYSQLDAKTDNKTTNEDLVNHWNVDDQDHLPLIVNIKGLPYLITAHVIKAGGGREEHVDFYKRPVKDAIDLKPRDYNPATDEPLTVADTTIKVVNGLDSTKASTTDLGVAIRDKLQDNIIKAKNCVCLVADADVTNEAKAVHDIRAGKK